MASRTYVRDPYQNLARVPASLRFVPPPCNPSEATVQHEGLVSLKATYDVYYDDWMAVNLTYRGSPRTPLFWSSNGGKPMTAAIAS